MSDELCKCERKPGAIFMVDNMRSKSPIHADCGKRLELIDDVQEAFRLLRAELAEAKARAEKAEAEAEARQIHVYKLQTELAEAKKWAARNSDEAKQHIEDLKKELEASDLGLRNQIAQFNDFVSASRKREGELAKGREAWQTAAINREKEVQHLEAVIAEKDKALRQFMSMLMLGKDGIWPANVDGSIFLVNEAISLSPTPAALERHVEEAVKKALAEVRDKVYAYGWCKGKTPHECHVNIVSFIESILSSTHPAPGEGKL